MSTDAVQVLYRDEESGEQVTGTLRFHNASTTASWTPAGVEQRDALHFGKAELLAVAAAALHHERAYLKLLLPEAGVVENLIEETQTDLAQIPVRLRQLDDIQVLLGPAVLAAASPITHLPVTDDGTAALCRSLTERLESSGVFVPGSVKVEPGNGFTAHLKPMRVGPIVITEEEPAPGPGQNTEAPQCALCGRQGVQDAKECPAAWTHLWAGRGRDGMRLPPRHGHVRPAAAVARCGGPALCTTCSAEKAYVEEGEEGLRVYVETQIRFQAESARRFPPMESKQPITAKFVNFEEEKLKQRVAELETGVARARLDGQWSGAEQAAAYLEGQASKWWPPGGAEDKRISGILREAAAQIRKLRPEDGRSLVDAAVTVLNEALRLSPDAICALVHHHVACTPGLVEHPTVQVRVPDAGVPSIGLLGIVNGILCRVQSDALVAAVVDQDSPAERVLRFERASANRGVQAPAKGQGR